ncbi:helix-turn-helix domain-containing protein [Streptomyces sp. NPDC005728]|uniref:helix-turn-helix domain-containing protein n=1 Tax=Streptomyces sp. NPDC005728 TaxID=3157054 RepID=UPI0033E7FD7A
MPDGPQPAPEPAHCPHRHRTAPGRSVLEGAFLLLEELARSGESGLTQLASRTDLSKATAHRLLDQLVALGAVHRHAGRYRMGSRAFRFGQAWQPAPLLRSAAAHPLRGLAAACRGSVSMSVRESDGVLVVGGMHGEADDVFPLRAGVVLPPASAAETVINGAHKDEVAYDYAAVRAPLCCVAAPVRTPAGAIVAAVAVVVLKENRHLLPSLAEATRRTADLVSANLARVPAAHRTLHSLAVRHTGREGADISCQTSTARADSS